MKQMMLWIGVISFIFASTLRAQDITGDWHGTLKAGGTSLRLVLHIAKGGNGGLKTTFDSVDQGANGIPVTSTTLQNSTLKLAVDAIHATYEGKVNADATSITGTWTQGQPFPLDFQRGTKDTAQLERLRPQNPVKPYPYREEDVAYNNKTQGIHLAAALTIPQGKGPFPAVVLITGSGPQDRDESLMGHRPFLVLADYLTRRGIEVLRADDRGVGKSSGNFSKATTADFATDAEAGLAYLKTRPEVNPHKLGLIGHSEGGVIAAMVAARNPDVAFIVMMAGPGVQGDELLPAQAAAIQEANGKSREEAEKIANEEREILHLAEHEKDDAVLEKKIREISGSKIPDAQLKAQIHQLRSPWFQYFLKYDPATALRKVTCPVLAIDGAKDRQVLPQQNLPAIRKALEAAGNTHFEVEELPGLNHLFQTAKTGSPSEYAEIEETIYPVALERISNWILKQ